MTPETEKNLKMAAIVGGGLLVAYLIFRSPKDAPANNGLPGQDPTGNGSYIPPVASFKASDVSAVLLQAMDKVGTDEDLILDTLKPVTQAQFAQVVTAFGKQPYNELYGMNFNPNAWYSELPKLSLGAWLKAELSDSDYKILKQRYPNSL